MIQSNKYHGLALEDPLDHLDNFDKLCGTTKINGISEDAFKLRLFPFSLGDKAHTWEKNLPRGSILTWDECKRAFLTKFFSTSRTANIRNEISGFQQKNLEGFGEAWERFKGYLAQCPHHGFTNESLLSTFYRGVLPKYRSRLDTASNGFYLGRTEDDALELVENMAQSDSVYSDEHDRQNRGGGGDDSFTRKELKSLQEKMDKLLMERTMEKTKQEKVQFVGEHVQEDIVENNEVEGLEGQQELCFINSNGQWYKKEPNFQYQDNFQSKPQYPNQYQQKPFYNNQQGNYPSKQAYPPGFSNQGYQPNQVQGSSSQAPAKDTNVESMFKQLLEAQSRSEKNIGNELKNIHAKIDGSYNELNNKFKTLESQFASMTSSSKRPMGSLPGKSEQNPKEYCNVILSTDVSKVEMSDYEKEVDEIERLFYGTEIVAKTETQIVEKVKHKVVKKIEILAVENVMEKVEQPIGQKVEKPVDMKAVQKLKEVKLEENLEIELSPYDKLPFPKRFLTKAQKKVIAKFRKDMSDVGVKLPEISNMHDAHVQMMLIKDILAHKEEVGELLDISIERLDPQVPPKSLPKLEDQGKFTLSCSLGKFTLDDALVDSGASVNVISMEMVKNLGIENMEPNSSTLTFGDSSSTTPIGLIKDFPLKIEECTIPIDLTVLDMITKRRVPLILGTPFLATVGACIDFLNKRVILHNVNKNVSYPIKSPMLNVEYCGTITCEELPKEKIKDGVVISRKESLNGESYQEISDEHLESAKKEGVSRATKAAHEKKKKMKESHPSPLDKRPHSLTLHPMKSKDGAIEYKIKCKERSKPFSSARAIITPQLQDDPIKLQELLSQILTITLEGGKDPPSH